MTDRDSYFKLLQGDFLLQKSPHHADNGVEPLACVLAIRDHFDQRQRGQLILCDDWPVCWKRQITSELQAQRLHVFTKDDSECLYMYIL